MMSKKIFSMFCIGAMFLTGAVSAQEQLPLANQSDLPVICRSGKCKTAGDMMTQEFLYTKFASLLKNNINKRVSFCNADVATHTCINGAIAFDATIGATPSTVYMPSALLIDTKSMSDGKTQKFVLDYDLKVGEIYPICQASLNQLNAPSINDVSIETTPFECRFTGSGMSVLSASYDVDFIDFDSGVIGAHYVIKLAQASEGEATGYALLRFASLSNSNDEVMDECGCVCNEVLNPPCQCDVSVADLQPQPAVQVDVVEQQEIPLAQEVVATEAKQEEPQPTEPVLQEMDAIVIKDAPASQQPIIVNEVMEEEIAVEPMPVLEEAKFITETQILKPGVPVVVDVEEDVLPGQVKAISNWDK